jgi:recombination protein RecA
MLEAHLRRARAREDATVRVVASGFGELDALLPDGGFPRSAVTELSATHGLGASTRIALASIASAQAEARLRGGESAWCAFLDPTSSLYGPGAKHMGIDLAKMLVVRPKPGAELGRVVSRVIASRVFSVVVVDTGGVPGASTSTSLASWAGITRRLALAAEEGDTSVLLLTHRESARPLPLPVAMRVELMEPARGRLSMRIGKERRGLVSGWRDVSLTPATPPTSIARAG